MCSHTEAIYASYLKTMLVLEVIYSMVFQSARQMWEELAFVCQSFNQQRKAINIFSVCDFMSAFCVRNEHQSLSEAS